MTCKITKSFALAAALFTTISLRAQPAANQPVTASAPARVAFIIETDDASSAADILTARLSGDQNIHLLERSEIAKVYREQALSMANKDHLKLGHILGADGLLLFNIVKTAQATNLTIRLIAVNPGVILSDGSFPWPLKDTTPWADSMAVYLDNFAPKLSLLIKDAIPISVVNLRSAVQSTESLEIEKNLKLLAIQRLSQERQFFVLERQRMQLLEDEKDLKSVESAFWNGSYLIEGIVDQNGFSKETVTINARLTPPKGGTPIAIEVSGSRTNLAEVVNALAVKIVKSLNVNPTAKEWNAADEAAQFFDEAKWALRWGVLPEARAAADSAWALGKRDMDCATVRIRSYMVEPDSSGYHTGEYTNPPKLEEEIAFFRQSGVGKLMLGFVQKSINWGKAIDADYIFSEKYPDPKTIGLAANSLQIYEDFTKSISADDQQSKTNAEWHKLGMENLRQASELLQLFHFIPESQNSAHEELSELRVRTRAVAAILSKYPSVHDGYYVGDRVATHEELDRRFRDGSDFYNYQVKWGYLWQETPEDCVAMYRELMRSPVFCYIHGSFWRRDLKNPRIAAWAGSDRKRIPKVWNDFLQELDHATNQLFQFEAKALRLADDFNYEQLTNSSDPLFEDIFKNRDLFVSNKVDLAYNNWGTGTLLPEAGRKADGADLFRRKFQTEYAPKFEEMEKEYHEYQDKIAAAGQAQQAFDAQKKFLIENQPYNLLQFSKTFAMRQYSKDQALEIQPLLAAYKANLLKQAEGLTGKESSRLKSGIGQVLFVENSVKQALNPNSGSAGRVVTTTRVYKSDPKPVQGPAISVTNVLEVSEFHGIPLESLRTSKVEEQLFDLGLSEPRLRGNKLWFDLHYTEKFSVMENNGVFSKTFAHFAAVVFDPQTAEWKTIQFPEPQKQFMSIPSPEFSETIGETLYVSGSNYLRRCDLKTLTWQKLPVPWQQNTRLVAVGNRLFAINNEAIFEMLEEGRNIKTVASSRRSPALNVLDSLGGFETASLFEGVDHSLIIAARNKVFREENADWRELFKVVFSKPPQVFDDGIYFTEATPNVASASEVPKLWKWDKTQPLPELCIYDRPRSQSFGQQRPVQTKSVWRPLSDDALLGSLATVRQSNIYFLVEHVGITNRDPHLTEAELANESKYVDLARRSWTVVGQNGYHAKLVCLTRGVTQPLVVPLKFDLSKGDAPFNALGRKINPVQFPWYNFKPWLFFINNTMYIGQSDAMGIWSLPVAKIDAAVGSQRQLQLEKLQKQMEHLNN